MALPKPEVGLVIRYAYLWHREAQSGLIEGRKDRPSALIGRIEREDEAEPLVWVLPITHSPPLNAEDAIEIPEPTRRRLGLDDERCWIVVTEYNQFIWPGPDLRPTPTGQFEYGFLPPKLFDEVRGAVIANVRMKKAKQTKRD